MSFEKLRAYGELLRPLNTVIIMVVIASAAFLAGGRGHAALQILIAALAGGFIGGAANIINDYFDVEIDRINKPNRPLPRGAVGKKEALLLWLILSLSGISLNLFLNFPALSIAVAAAFFLFLYSAKLKGTILAGNVIVAGMTGLAFIYGAIVVDHPELSLIPACFAFLINIAREIVKDVEDMEGDRLGNATTLPLKYGAKPALFIASSVLIILIAATLWPYLAGTYSETYLFIVLLVDIILLLSVAAMWRDSSPVNLRKVSLLLKLDMVLGLVAISFGS